MPTEEESAQLKDAREASLMEKWATGKKLTEEQFSEIEHLLPASQKKPEAGAENNDGRIDFSRLKKTELSAALNIDLKTITRWQASGLPFVSGTPGGGRGQANTYNLPDVIRWWIRKETKNGLDSDEEKAKLLKEQAESARRKNALQAGDVISMKSVREILQRFCSGLRQKIVISAMTKEEKQALLMDIQAMRKTDFDNVEEIDDLEPESE